MQFSQKVSRYHNTTKHANQEQAEQNPPAANNREQAAAGKVPGAKGWRPAENLSEIKISKMLKITSKESESDKCWSVLARSMFKAELEKLSPPIIFERSSSAMADRGGTTKSSKKRDYLFLN
jgi:hypothetical protein